MRAPQQPLARLTAGRPGLLNGADRPCRAREAPVTMMATVPERILKGRCEVTRFVASHGRRRSRSG